jgi:hypothetical protein
MKVYITFGQIHVHSVNGKTFDKNCVAVIECSSYSDGREKAFGYFLDKWHNCYEDEPEMFWFPRGLIEVN